MSIREHSLPVEMILQEGQCEPSWAETGEGSGAREAG